MPPETVRPLLNERLVEVELLGKRYENVALWMQLPPTAKQPEVRLNPTFEVLVALPAIEKPLTVVVPNPFPATDKNLVALDDEATSKTGFVCPPIACTASLAHGVVVPNPTDPSTMRPFVGAAKL